MFLKIIIFSFYFLFLFSLSLHLETETKDRNLIVKTINKFTLDLYKIISKNGNYGNIILSPFSVFEALTLLTFGAAGDTRDEFYKVLNLENLSEGDQLQIVNNKLLLYLYKNHKSSFKIGSKLFIDSIIKLEEEFSNKCIFFNLQTPETIDFRKPIQAANELNNWISMATEGKITKLVEAQNLNSNTKMILLNAIHFKGMWEDQFNKEFTEEGQFINLQGNKKKVKMMKKIGKFFFKHNEQLDADELQLGYHGNFVFTAIISNNILDTEKKLGLENLGKFERNISGNLYLPKFNLSFQSDLIEPLSSIGFKNIFLSSANFSKMSKTEMEIQNIFHKSVISLSEEGSEVSSLTMVQFMRKSISVNQIKFDKPFLFLIREKFSGLVLFIGRVADI